MWLEVVWIVQVKWFPKNGWKRISCIYKILRHEKQIASGTNEKLINKVNLFLSIQWFIGGHMSISDLNVLSALTITEIIIKIQVLGVSHWKLKVRETVIAVCISCKQKYKILHQLSKAIHKVGASIAHVSEIHRTFVVISSLQMKHLY